MAIRNHILIILTISFMVESHEYGLNTTLQKLYNSSVCYKFPSQKLKNDDIYKVCVCVCVYKVAFMHVHMYTHVYLVCVYVMYVCMYSETCLFRSPLGHGFLNLLSRWLH